MALLWQVALRRFPEVEVATPRVHVRPLVIEDAKAVTEIFADRLTQRWLPFPAEYGPAEALSWCTELAEERRCGGLGDHYAALRRDDSAMVGCLWAKRTDWAAKITEISYAVTPTARGEGYAAEAVDALAMALIRQHGLHRVELRVAPGNIASRRVAEKAGFSYEGLLRNAGYLHAGRVDLELWSLVSADLG